MNFFELKRGRGIKVEAFREYPLCQFHFINKGWSRNLPRCLHHFECTGNIFHGKYIHLKLLKNKKKNQSVEDLGRRDTKKW